MGEGVGMGEGECMGMGEGVDEGEERVSEGVLAEGQART
jgi:hypothetical protein